MDENIIDEFQVLSKTTDNCVEPTIIQSIVVKRKLSQSEVDRMVQEAEKSRDEDEVNESRPRVLWRNSALLCETHRLRETLGKDQER